MSNTIVCQSLLCRFAQSGKWGDTMSKNPMYIGTNGSGTYVYVGQWVMPTLSVSRGDIKKITLHIYRNSNASTYSRDEYIGCSSNLEDYASVLSTGIKITLSAREGWKAIDVTGLAEYICEYDYTWYLLIGNPNGKNSYVEIAGYGTDKMLYLEIELADGSRIYLSSNGVLTPHQLYHSENGSLVRYDLYRSENGSLIRY